MSHIESNKSQAVWALLPVLFQTSLQNYFLLFHLPTRRHCCRCEALPNEAIPCVRLWLTHTSSHIKRWIHPSLPSLITFFNHPFLHVSLPHLHILNSFFLSAPHLFRAKGGTLDSEWDAGDPITDSFRPLHSHFRHSVTGLVSWVLTSLCVLFGLCEAFECLCFGISCWCIL